MRERERGRETCEKKDGSKGRRGEETISVGNGVSRG